MPTLPPTRITLYHCFRCGFDAPLDYPCAPSHRNPKGYLCTTPRLTPIPYHQGTPQYGVDPDDWGYL